MNPKSFSKMDPDSDPDPHKIDSDPHSFKSWIRIRIKSMRIRSNGLSEKMRLKYLD
jgi:hypothetical protein